MGVLDLRVHVGDGADGTEESPIDSRPIDLGLAIRERFARILLLNRRIEHLPKWHAAAQLKIASWRLVNT